MKKKLLVFEQEEEPPGTYSTEILSKEVLLKDAGNGVRKEKSPIFLFSPLRSFPLSGQSDAFRKKYFPKTDRREWSDWKWQLSNCITRREELERFVSLTASERQALESSEVPLAFSVTPYYLSLVESLNSEHSLRRSVVPLVEETAVGRFDLQDPLSEHDHEVAPGLVHRYPDRVLFLATDFCSTYCRYCTRSRVVGKHHLDGPREKQWQEAIAYIKNNPVVRDVLISGGDPLTLSDSSLEWLLKRLRAISHVEIIRIGTKIPAVLPMRVTPELTGMLKKYHPLFLSLHFTRPEELTEETQEACTRLADAGIPLGSQTVLLKGINDDAEVLKKLFQKLLVARVKPYYLYQCDPVTGSGHFRTAVEKGLEIMSRLRGFTSGYALPTYVVDAPGGGGKIPLYPDPVRGREGENLVLENYLGKEFRYPDPEGTITTCRRTL